VKLKNISLSTGRTNFFWVIHGYDKVDDVIIWGIISKYLPELRKEIIRLLE